MDKFWGLLLDSHDSQWLNVKDNLKKHDFLTTACPASLISAEMNLV
jgi:hypothetical protein